MDSRGFKNRLYAEFALIGKALANAHRLEILDLLAQGERSVEDLAQEGGLSLANASAHLQVLRRTRLVTAEKRGLNAIYRLAAPEVFQLWQTVRDLGSAQLAEIDRLVQTYLADRAALEPIDKQELVRRLAAYSTIVIDVRPVIEYRQGHIAGARSAPVEQIEQLLAGLPQDCDVIAYCRGPYCVLADEAVAVLRHHGFRALRLRDGFPEWQAAGYPIEALAPAS
ncbi:MAG: metalloregulator ArsR/SmtB family transcription factor [Chloroflexi bacterium]|nr:metalloregulator ArsR/SmtB family transcription factor [Chloroflexota bacterium]